MTDLTVTGGAGLPAYFDPSKSHDKQSQSDAIIEYARKVKDWDLLERAVDAKVDEQSEFVAWWDANVGIRQDNRKPVTDRVTGLPVDEAERLTGFDKMAVSRIRNRLKNPETYRAQLFGAAYKKAFPLDTLDENHRARGTSVNEWYTPPQYIAMAREVMGGIDLDPATSEVANDVVKAEKYFTVKDDGLSQDWFGRVWLNPPYSQPAIFNFIEKLTGEYSAGNVDQAICLTHNYTDTQWFHLAASVCSAVCFTRGRIGFLSPTGEKASATQGQAFFYYGSNTAGFTAVFSAVGVVFIR